MTEAPQAPSGGEAPKRDLAAEFKQQPLAEKILGVAAAAFLLAFIIGNRWSALFHFGGDFAAMYQPWKHTLAFIGAVAVLVLVVTKLMGIRLVDPKLYSKLLVGAAVLPALGLLVEELRDFWGFVMLAGIVLMAYAGAKITTRENILK